MSFDDALSLRKGDRFKILLARKESGPEYVYCKLTRWMPESGIPAFRFVRQNGSRGILSLNESLAARMEKD